MTEFFFGDSSRGKLKYNMPLYTIVGTYRNILLPTNCPWSLRIATIFAYYVPPMRTRSSWWVNHDTFKLNIFSNLQMISHFFWKLLSCVCSTMVVVNIVQKHHNNHKMSNLGWPGFWPVHSMWYIIRMMLVNFWMTREWK